MVEGKGVARSNLVLNSQMVLRKATIFLAVDLRRRDKASSQVDQRDQHRLESDEVSGDKIGVCFLSCPKSAAEARWKRDGDAMEGKTRPVANGRNPFK